MTTGIIAAAGRGERYTNGGNKVFAPLLGRPMLLWTVEAMASHPQIDGVVVVTGADDISKCREVLSQVDKVLAIVAGGKSRQESVYIGLAALGGAHDDLVAVHDGARPLVDHETIDRCLAGARANGNAVAAIPIVDTIKAAGADNTVMHTVEREGLWAVQTPQVFPWRALAKAHLAARDGGFEGTDDASVVEFLGEYAIHLVAGSPENIKITRPADARIAEAILASRHNAAVPASEIRVGFGYDIHRFAPERRLILGGVEFAPVDGKGLDGHSDADVLLHAICDALLGAAALPDIGSLFPNTDPAYRNISSLVLLEEVRSRVESLGFGIVNVDATVIAERRFKIGSAVPQMRGHIAQALRIDQNRVGIKATTNEGLGAIGEGLGIAAHAVATVSRK